MRCIRKDSSHGTILQIEGALDAVTAPELRPVIESLISERCEFVVVDLSSLRVLDSSGVGALVSLYKRLREQGGEVRAIGVRGQPLMIFRLLRLDVYFCGTRMTDEAPRLHR
jgi:anti-sigma B factor antagonist